MKIIFYDKGEEGLDQKVILHNEGGGWGSTHPLKDDIICTSVPEGHPYEVFVSLCLTKTMQSILQFGVAGSHR